MTPALIHDGSICLKLRFDGIPAPGSHHHLFGGCGCTRNLERRNSFILWLLSWPDSVRVLTEFRIYLQGTETFLA